MSYFGLNIAGSAIDAFQTAENITALHQPLTLRADLSTRTIRRLASFVGTALLESLSARRGLDDDTRVYLNRRLRARLERGDLPYVEEDQAERSVIIAAHEGSLDEEFVDEAAKTGNKEAVITALAMLGHVAPQTVQRILESHSAKAIIALVWKARLSMRVAFKIQNSIAKLPAREILPARNGKDFPLTEEEMRWQLDYFDVPMPPTAGSRPFSDM